MSKKIQDYDAFVEKFKPKKTTDERQTEKMTLIGKVKGFIRLMNTAYPSY